MANSGATSPVEESVPKTGDVAVGENLDFQRKWWKFERGIWIFFLLLLVCDVLGLFGRGWLAKAKKQTADGALMLDYERIERASTPSIMTLHFGANAIHDGKVKVFVSDSVVRPLGAQRVSPQPEVSALTAGGITYTFAALTGPTTVEIALEPSFPGSHEFRMQVIGAQDDSADVIDGKVFVVP